MSKHTWYILIVFVSLSMIYFVRLMGRTSQRYSSGMRVKIKARLAQEPILKDNKQTFKIADFDITAPRWPEYSYGETLILVGRVKKIVLNPFFSKKILMNPAIVVQEENEVSGPLTLKIMIGAEKVREKTANIFLKDLPEPHASLISGMVLGSQKSMPRRFYNNLKNTGTMHIIVASGMNISLVANLVLSWLCKVIKRRLAVLISFFFILGYCLLAGFSPPILRAGIMAFLAGLAVVFGREATGLVTLIITGYILLLIKPLSLFDVGFQLSFSATAGLIILPPVLKKHLSFLTKIPYLIESLSAQLATLPIILITFGNYNLLSLIPNLLVLWLVPYLMALGGLMAVSSFLPLLPKFLAMLSFLPLTYFIEIINFFGKLNWFNVKFQGLS